MRLLFVLLFAAALAGCGKDDPIDWGTILRAAEDPAPHVPAECKVEKGDPQWVDVPDADVPLDEGSRNYRANKATTRTLADLRAICWAGLEAQQQSAPAPPDQLAGSP